MNGLICRYCKGTKKIRLLYSDVDCLDCLVQFDEKIAHEVVWKIDEAIELIRKLEIEIKPIKYTSSLGGGVLFKGESYKDLDIFIAPYNKTDKDYDALIKILENMGFIRKKTKEEVHKGFEYCGDGGKEHKHVEIWEYNGKRVDFFFVE